MKKYLPLTILAGMLFFVPAPVLAASNGEIETFTRETLTALIGLAAIATVVFLIRGAYIYITSTGNPAALEDAKRTIKQALIGLTVVIGASVFASLLNNAMAEPAVGVSGTAINLSPIQPAAPAGSLTQILLDAIAGFLQNIIQSATKPILDGIIWFLTSTPPMSTNSVVFNFWLVIVGITDSLFAIVIALLGFRIMSASTFGFEEITLKEIFPRIALAFVGANTSIFLIDWLISLCQTMISALLNATGGLSQAWILNAFDPAALLTGTTALITLIFIIVFIVLSVVLLLFYISRLMLLAFGAVISPLVCLLWLIPRMFGLAEGAINAYFINVFILFVHVVIIQLASAFLTIPGQSGENPVIAVLIGIALFSILLKSTATAMQLALTAQTTGAFRKISGQILNVLTPASGTAAVAATARTAGAHAKVIGRHA